MMKRLAILLTAGAALPVTLAATGPKPAATPAAPTAKPPLDLSTLHVQVILDHLGFSPGILDGRPGISLTQALKGFQESRTLPVTGQIDAATLNALHRYRGWRPTKAIALGSAMLAGPFVGRIPHNEDDQAKLPALAYRTKLEKLAEMFHTTPAVLIELNSPATKLAPGTTVTFPNALPTSRAYPAELTDGWKRTLNDLNVDATEPVAARIVVDKSDSVLRVFDRDDKLVAQFQVTTGSEHDPLPLGTHKVTNYDYNPKFRYNPALFWDAKSSDQKAMLPAGPNGPVGVVWMNLNIPHYGIHGTPEPQYIGRTESHGCVRMTNWNAARLTLMMKPGIPVIFQA
ncbi:L,D-transpeptidase family protein [Sphingomonas bacterium]|uniref:L,D-transpeptidase family protein n=1 Tax=Sphingomonas bacterium TaxID=1895847 RepID=UPI0020C5D71B|nr:L,D-transpeptidase family protein [Sphingomonas bacterium]